MSGKKEGKVDIDEVMLKKVKPALQKVENKIEEKLEQECCKMCKGLKQDMAKLETSLKDDMAKLETSLKDEFGELGRKMDLVLDLLGQNLPPHKDDGGARSSKK